MIKNIINLILRYHTSIQRHTMQSILLKLMAITRINNERPEVYIPDSSEPKRWLIWNGGASRPVYLKFDYSYYQVVQHWHTPPLYYFKYCYDSILVFNRRVKSPDFILVETLLGETPNNIRTVPTHYWHYRPDYTTTP